MKHLAKTFGKWSCVCMVVLSLTVAASAADYISPKNVLPTKDGRGLYIAEATANQVALLDIASGKVTKTTKLPGAAEGLALSPDGKTLYVTSSAAAGKVCVLDAKTLERKECIAVGHTPGAPVVSPDGKTLYVCNRHNNNVAVIDLASKKITATIDVIREPIGAALTLDGKFLYVANHLPTTAADQDYVASSVSVIDTTTKKVCKDLLLPNGAIDLRDLIITPDGRYVLTTQILARYQLPTTQLERGWIATNSLTVIDTAKQEIVNTVLLDDVDLGAANPWGIAVSADSKTVCVSHAGTHEVSVIDFVGLLEKFKKVEAGEEVSDASSSAEDVPNDLAFLVGLRRRLALKGNGPRGLAVIGSKAYAAEYFTDSIGVVNIDPKERPDAKSIALGPETPLTLVRKGEMFFNDATLCFQKWLSCASCHPDVRTDAVNWDLLNDGMGNPKNTKSLLLSHKTAPAMITGIRPDAETAVRAGIQYIQFAVRPEEDALALDAFLKQVEPIPSPYLVDGKLSKSAERGKEIFSKASCSRCHPSDKLYTNRNLYDIGTGIGMEEGQEFDTPSLVEAWRSSPYLYDGRAASMEEVLTKYNKENKHGNTKDLSKKQIKDLAEFVLSL